MHGGAHYPAFCASGPLRRSGRTCCFCQTACALCAVVRRVRGPACLTPTFAANSWLCGTLWPRGQRPLEAQTRAHMQAQV
eukprot:7084527-Alexandrium_andersonii.AAC.1